MRSGWLPLFMMGLVVSLRCSSLNTYRSKIGVLTIPASDQVMFGDAVSRVLRTMASRHVFKLNAMTLGEAHRLQTFLQNADLSMYPELADLGEKIFVTARLSCHQEIQAFITKLDRAA